MNRKIKNTLLSLTLTALLIPAVGCDYDLDRHASRGDWSSYWLDFTFVPGYSTYDTWDTYTYEEVYVEDTYETTYYDSYYTDSYYDDYEYYDDYGWSWKNKTAGKKK